MRGVSERRKEGRREGGRQGEMSEESEERERGREGGREGEDGVRREKRMRHELHNTREINAASAANEHHSYGSEPGPQGVYLACQV